MQAALDGAEEVGFTVLSMCCRSSAVFIPLMFMGGIIGRLFREFAVTISVVGARLGLRRADADADAVQPPAQAARKDEKHGRFFNITERGFDGAAARLRAQPRLGDARIAR